MAQVVEIIMENGPVKTMAADLSTRAPSQYKNGLSRYGDSHVKYKIVLSL